MGMQVDLYENEVGGLYLHRKGDATAYAHIERDLKSRLADFEDTLGGLDGWSVFKVLAVEAYRTWEPWFPDNDGVPFEQVVKNAALVASFFEDGGAVEIQDGSKAGTLPPGPNATIMLDNHHYA
jgi:hypothetical protein